MYLPFVEYLPIENLVFVNQQQYYDAIARSSAKADSCQFIDFMLTEILNTLKHHQGEPLTGKVPNGIPNKLNVAHPQLTDMAWLVLEQINKNGRSTSLMIGTKLGISDRMVRKYILQLRNASIIERIGGNRSGYWQIINETE